MQILLKSLPAPCPAAIFAVVHTSPEGPGFLPTVLSRASGHLALHATHGAPFEPGNIYVAPPDRHITLG
ncbi:MAG TPA: chemotaxis protein CheB, partial [Terriglobales bacterium]|nr:chemotaxis protein CheB [Terriglobales bacterium]